jgi:transposase
VFLWREAFRKQGEGGLKAKPAPGRPPKLTSGQKGL